MMVAARFVTRSNLRYKPRSFADFKYICHIEQKNIHTTKRTTFITLCLIFAGFAQSQDIIVNASNRDVFSLNGKWNYIIDPYENGVKKKAFYILREFCRQKEVEYNQ